MSALRPAFFILYLESYISRLNEILRHDLTLSVSEPDNAAAQTGAGTSFGANGDQHTRAAELSTYFCVLTIRKHLLKIRFERSGRGQEPSRGHKFSILENVVLHWDFTSAMRLHFRSDLVGACLPQTLLMVTVHTERSSCPCFAAALSGSLTESVRSWHGITFRRLIQDSRCGMKKAGRSADTTFCFFQTQE